MAVYKFVGIALVILTLLLGSNSQAEIPKLKDTFRGDHIVVELRAESAQISKSQPTTLGVRFIPEPGWHVYWKNPGDSGAPAKFRWSIGGGYALTPQHTLWPYPEKIPYGPLANFGYSSDTLVLFEFANSELPQAANLAFDLDLEWLVCKEECLPGNALLKILLSNQIPSQEVVDSESQTLFQKARERVPSDQFSNITTATFDDKFINLNFNQQAFGATPREIIFFPDIKGISQPAKEQTLTRMDNGGFTLRIPRGHTVPPVSENLKGVLTITESSQYTEAYLVNIKLSSDDAQSATQDAGKLSLLAALALGFLGGLILNLMPCVFPVLSLKVMSLVDVSNKERVAARKEAWAYTAGIIASLASFGVAISSLQSIGNNIGWGFQLQSPTFVSLLALLTFALGLNMAGTLQFGEGIQVVAGRSSLAKGRLGAFGHGILAVVLATPCTAPFMGSALAYALGAEPLVGIAVFTSLGLGLSLPVLLIAYVPAVVRVFPRPGAWMEKLKGLLAFPLFATTIWLGWVLSLQAGTQGIIRLSVAIFALSFGAWLSNNTLRKQHHKRLVLILFVLIAVAIAIPSSNNSAISSSTSSSIWQTYDEAQIAKFRQENKAVFVDYTAAWCITCQVNKLSTLNTETVLSEFSKHDVRLFRADWTNQDPAITASLKTFGRQSVPLYVLYPKGNSSTPVILPSLLTPGIITDALRAMP